MIIDLSFETFKALNPLPALYSLSGANVKKVAPYQGGVASPTLVFRFSDVVSETSFLAWVESGSSSVTKVDDISV